MQRNLEALLDGVDGLWQHMKVASSVGSFSSHTEEVTDLKSSITCAKRWEETAIQ